VGRLDALCAVCGCPELVCSEGAHSFARYPGNGYRTGAGGRACDGNLSARSCLEQRGVTDVVCPDHEHCSWRRRTSELFGIYGAWLRGGVAPAPATRKVAALGISADLHDRTAA